MENEPQEEIEISTQEPGKEDLSPESKKGWQDWLTKKRGLLYKTAAPIIAAPIIASAIIVACDRAQENTQDTTPTPTPAVTESISPTPAETNGPQITPIKTKEATPTPAAISSSQTPTPESPRPTPQVTEKPEPDETPQLTEAPQEKNYEIIDKGTKIQGPEEYSYDEAVKIISDWLDKYPALMHPQLGKLKIEIYLGGESRYIPTEHRMEMDRSQNTFEDLFKHEWFHSVDNVLKNNDQGIRENILTDPTIGKQFPNIDKLINSNYVPTLIKYQDGDSILTLDELGELASNYSDNFWITRTNWDQLNNLFKDTGLENKTGQYSSISQFFEDPDIKKTLESNKYWSYIHEIIMIDPDKWEAFMDRIYPHPSSDKNAQTLIGAFTQTGRLILAEKILDEDPEIQKLFEAEDLNTIKKNLETEMKRADAEHLAELVSKYLILKESERLTETHPSLENIIQTINTLSQSQ